MADIACGSGAFLVAAARYLAGELTEAWRLEGITPAGSPERVRLMATRKVVASCLYGVDINDMAVEMCKLSLWLVSLDPHLPFSFVDNKIFHGNSLLGVTSLNQIKAMRIDAKQRDQGQLFEVNALDQSAETIDVDGILRKVRRLRDQLSDEITPNDPQRSANAKRRQMREVDATLTRVRTIADGVIAAGLAHGGKPGNTLDDAYDTLAVAVGRAFPAHGEGDTAMLEGVIDRGLTPTVPTDYEHWRCVHWPLEIPEVMENGGFDAIIGNPPFLGGKKLSGAMGDNMREWFVNVIAEGQTGSADLCAYFFLRAYGLLRRNGTLGLLATNTIAQGDTREVGLDRMADSGFTITRSIQSQPWPVKSATLEYAAVWGNKGSIPDDISKDSDGVVVQRISTLLEPEGRATGTPKKLKENEGIAFIGCYVLGEGFIITLETAQSWIVTDPKNRNVLYRYLNGDDLNSNPDCSASRWVIDFTNYSEEEASHYQLPYKQLLDTVKEERLQKKDAAASKTWWRFARPRFEMREAIASLDEVLAMTRVSKTIMPLRVTTKQILSDSLCVFASKDYATQAVLSSSLHQLWAINRGSGMRGDPRYTPSDVFETFPRPKANEQLETIGRTLDTERREIMLRRDLGLTDLYNLVNAPELEDSSDKDVARLREIHRELDEAVMAAYGWDDVPLRHGFHTYRKMTRWTVCPEARVEILDRLLEENHRRAKLESAGKEQ